MRRRSAHLALAATLVSCSAGTALKNLPRSEIDRPYTLPRGVDSWSASATVFAPRDDTGVRDATIGAKAEWALPLSDDWALLLGPPVGVAHEFLREGAQRIGATLRLYSGFSFSGGTDVSTEVRFLFDPVLRVDHRVRLSSRWAWDTVVSGEVWRWTDQPRWASSAGAGTGPLFQVAEAFALEPSVAVAVSRNYLAVDPATSRLGDYLAAGIELAALWSPGRQWDLSFRAGYEITRGGDGRRVLYGGATIVNFW